MILSDWEGGGAFNWDREDEICGKDHFVLGALNLIGGEIPMWKCLAVDGNGAWDLGEVKARDIDSIA